MVAKELIEFRIYTIPRSKTIYTNVFLTFLQVNIQIHGNSLNDGSQSMGVRGRSAIEVSICYRGNSHLRVNKTTNQKIPSPTLKRTDLLHHPIKRRNYKRPKRQSSRRVSFHPFLSQELSENCQGWRGLLGR